MNRLQVALETFAGRRPVPPPPDPLQRPTLFTYPDLEARPFWDVKRFPWVARLQQAVPEIRSELDAVLRARSGFQTVWAQTTEAGSWAAMWLYLYGVPYADNTARCPATADLLAGIPRRTGWACFSAMSAGTHVSPHCGTTNAKLRCHLPLDVPDGCRMRVGQESRSWAAGELLIFDDSFEHEVWTAGDRPRFVLVFDVYHPDLRLEEIALLDVLQKKHDLAGAVDRHAAAGTPDRSGSCSWVYGHGA